MITIQNFCGSSLVGQTTFVVPEFLTVSNLAAEIEHRNGLPANSVRLIFNSRFLSPQSKLLDCGIVDGSVINVLTREPMTPEQKARVQQWIYREKPTPQKVMTKSFVPRAANLNCKTKQPRTPVFIPIPFGMGKHIVSTLAYRSDDEERAALALISLSKKKV